MSGVVVSILGPLDVQIDGIPITIAGPKQRAVLAALAVRANQVVSTDALIGAVWGDEAPDGADHSLQQHVSALRKLLAADRPTGSPGILSTRDPGYVLHADHVDAHEFERLAQIGFDATAAARLGDARAAFDAALACWRGPVLADIPDSPTMSALAVRLEEQRLAVRESRFDALLAAGEARQLVAELEHLVAEFPFRERLRGQLMLALYRSGRQTEALAAFQEARRVLIDELGIEPSAALRALEQAILLQSDDLEPGPPASRPAPADPMFATFRLDAEHTGGVELPDGQFVLLPEGPVVLGRDPLAPIRLVDSRVSRRHAEIATVGGSSTLSDLQSTNGTTVNGSALTADHVLRDGEVISLGGVELRYRAGSSEIG